VVEQLSTKPSLFGFSKLDLPVHKRMMRRALIRVRVVVEQAIDVVEPAAVLLIFLFPDQLLDVTLTHVAGRVCDLGWIRPIHSRPGLDALVEEPSVDENGNSADAHPNLLKQKSPAVRFIPRISGETYFGRADTL
jgi:hypothetical protein